MLGLSEGPTFDPLHDIPDLSGKVVLVTGGNAGLGKETILQLAKHNPSRLYLAARTPLKAEAAIRDIKASVPNANIIFLQLDLTRLNSVKEAANKFLASSDRLDLLINNAGIMAQPAGLTADGYEIQFGTNHLGHALLTKLLLPTLEKTSQQPGADVRVVTVSSTSYKTAPKGGIVFATLKNDMADYNTFTRYSQTKVANILFAAELARRYPRITSVSCHPGIVDTQLGTAFRSEGRLKNAVMAVAVSVVGSSLANGAKNQLWCAAGKGVVSGSFYLPVGKFDKGRGWPDDKKLGRKLWDWTDEELGKKGYA